MLICILTTCRTKKIYKCRDGTGKNFLLCLPCPDHLILFPCPLGDETQWQQTSDMPWQFAVILCDTGTCIMHPVKVFGAFLVDEQELVVFSSLGEAVPQQQGLCPALQLSPALTPLTQTLPRAGWLN